MSKCHHATGAVALLAAETSGAHDDGWGRGEESFLPVSKTSSQYCVVTGPLKPHIISWLQPPCWSHIPSKRLHLAKYVNNLRYLHIFCSVPPGLQQLQMREEPPVQRRLSQRTISDGLGSDEKVLRDKRVGGVEKPLCAVTHAASAACLSQALWTRRLSSSYNVSLVFSRGLEPWCRSWRRSFEVNGGGMLRTATSDAAVWAAAVE